jgi:tRNA U34 5-methylaminomethyl-2-thiouridine-forming methyltransferase MnmC
MMKCELRITEDGSHTVYLPDLEEPYHSIHGALRESKHVYIMHGLQTVDKEHIRILEAGFGTGLNALLTLAETGRSGQSVYYHTVDKYPLDPHVYRSINHENMVEGIPPGTLTKMHEAPWGRDLRLTDHFSLYKELSDFRTMDPPGRYDLVYFDAFDPQKQPHLWTPEVFSSISRLTHTGAVLVTYSARGSVRRALESNDFHVDKVPGPPGKRDMIRATRR